MREKAQENISIDTDCGSDLPEINGDDQQLEKAFLNIANNAVEAMPGGGRLTIASRNVLPADNVAGRFPSANGANYTRISFSDTGCGINEEIVDHIFEPLFTTKEKTKYPGFGLSIAYRIVKNHNGFIDFQTSAGQATTFEVFLPNAQ